MSAAATPSFNGLTLFGLSPTMVVQSIPPSRQERGYPGLDGVVSLAMGTRGLQVSVSGVLYAESVLAYDALEDLWRSYLNGLPYPLVTTVARTFPYSILEEFSPDPGKLQYSGRWKYIKKYSARFRALV